LKQQNGWGHEIGVSKLEAALPHALKGAGQRPSLHEQAPGSHRWVVNAGSTRLRHSGSESLEERNKTWLTQR
jgi:hypothetical protein